MAPKVTGAQFHSCVENPQDRFELIEAKPENLIGDRAYDSDPLDAELRKDGIEMITGRVG
jgi:hypothetical protein